MRLFLERASAVVLALAGCAALYTSITLQLSKAEARGGAESPMQIVRSAAVR